MRATGEQIQLKSISDDVYTGTMVVYNGDISISIPAFEVDGSPQVSDLQATTGRPEMPLQ